MKTDVVFIGTSRSNLAVQRYNLAKYSLRNLNFVFYDLYDSNIKSFPSQVVDDLKNEISIWIHIKRFFNLAFFIIFKRPSILHFHNVSNQFVNLCAFLTFARVISTPQGSDINQNYRGLNKFFTWVLLKRSNIITTKSDKMSERVLQICGKQSTVLHWGVADVFTTLPIKPVSGKFTIFSCRAFEPIYNIEIILSAVKSLKDAGFDIHFIVSSRVDSAFLRECKFIDELHISASSYLMESLYSRSDLVVSIPSFDGFSTSVIEALCCGSYILMSDLDAYDVPFFDSSNSIKVPLNKLDKLDYYIIKSFDNLSLLRSRREARSSNARKAFSVQSQVDLLSEIYSKV